MNKTAAPSSPPKAGDAKSANVLSPADPYRKNATTLFGLRIKDIQRSLVEYSQQPREFAQIVHRDKLVLEPLRKVKGAAKSLRRPLGRQIYEAARTKQTDERDPLSAFNQDMTTIVAS
ncbi:MAG TPA: hypothetical protein VNZ04_06090, partial [Trinickia sp.]|nr:hypothetical protein [Trinickia sp.]